MTATTTTRLNLKFEVPVARITLESPPLNVIDIPMMVELAGAVAEIEQHPEISVIVLDSNGKAFSAGVDVAAHTPDKVKSMSNAATTVPGCPVSRCQRIAVLKCRSRRCRGALKGRFSADRFSRSVKTKGRKIP